MHFVRACHLVQCEFVFSALGLSVSEPHVVRLCARKVPFDAPNIPGLVREIACSQVGLQSLRKNQLHLARVAVGIRV